METPAPARTVRELPAPKEAWKSWMFLRFPGCAAQREQLGSSASTRDSALQLRQGGEWTSWKCWLLLEQQSYWVPWLSCTWHSCSPSVLQDRWAWANATNHPEFPRWILNSGAVSCCLQGCSEMEFFSPAVIQDQFFKFRTKSCIEEDTVLCCFQTNLFCCLDAELFECSYSS